MDPDPLEPPPENNASGWRRYVHLEYCRRPIGILKVFEWIVSLLALIIMGSLPNTEGSGLSSIEFFIFIFTTVWVCTTVYLAFQILDIWRRLPKIICHNHIVLGVSQHYVPVKLFYPHPSCTHGDITFWVVVPVFYHFIFTFSRPS